MAVNILASDNTLDVRYAGKVLDTFERNMHDDSDFYAIVWDEEQERLDAVEYATTRAWTYGNSAFADASPDVEARARQWLHGWLLSHFRSQAEHYAKEVIEGKTVRITRGRSQYKGMTGRVFWMRNYYRYGYYRYTKVGVALSERRDDRGRYVDVAWTYARNLDVLNWEQHMPSEEELQEMADRNTDRFYLPFSRPGIPNMVS